MRTGNQVFLFTCSVFVLFSMFIAQAFATECTIETLNDPSICDEAGLLRLLGSLNQAERSVYDYDYDVDFQIVTLKSGWNIVSTPRVLVSHEFSVIGSSTNFDIYLLDPSSPSSWKTMQEVGQTEFQPLYAYFIRL